MINIVTNVTLYDGIRIKHTVPNWVKIFNIKIKSLRIIVDEKPVEGRIKSSHTNNNIIYSIDEALSELLNKYPFINVEKLNYAEAEDVSSNFFKKGNPIRCQLGTPIFAFLKGIHSIDDGIILRTDCDILYYDGGWVDKSIQALIENKYDIIEPPILGEIDYGFSSRCFLVNKKRFIEKMPIKAYKLDPLRRIDRILKKRSVYLALEQMIQKEIDRNYLKCKKMENNLGFSIHFNHPDDFRNSGIEDIINSIEKNSLPSKQKTDWNFNQEYWKDIHGN